MITISNEDINSSILSQTLEKLDNCTSLPGKTVHYFNIFKANWDKQTLKARKEYTEMMHEHALKTPVMIKNGDKEEPKRDDDGKIVERIKTQEGPNGPEPAFKDPKKFKESYDSFLSKTLEIDVKKFHVKQFAKADLTPKEIRSLAPITLQNEEYT